MNVESLLVPLEKLTSHCDPDSLGIETTKELGPLEGTVGQDRAISALDFGLRVDASGYNIYVVGFPGTGRTTTLQSFLNRAARDRPVPSDWCYVHNFRDPQQPVAVQVPAGFGRQLVNDMEELIRDCLRDIPGAFESEEYRSGVEEAMKGIQEKREAITRGIDEEASRQGFNVQPSPAGILTTPLIDGQPITREVYATLPEEAKASLRLKSEALQDFINAQLVELRKVEREAVHVRDQVDKDVVLGITAPAFMELKDKYKNVTELLAYLDAVREDIAEHVEEFRVPEEQRQQMEQHQWQGEPPVVRETVESERFLRYKVNVLVDNGQAKGAPVVFEWSPTYYNLFGRLEYRPRFGTAATDLTMIRPGAIHFANGGYLAVQARDMLTSPLAWESLKRVLRSGKAFIENIAEQYSPIPTATLRPQPIPVNAKIILMGTPFL
ncbi:MAG: AAA family ATPase, partial [Chloroflexi bacterium]|nr:AAA family ATPase [Chloroflexota bacterium]